MRASIAVVILAVSSTMAFAQAEKKDPGSLSNKQMEQQGTAGGTTAAPTAKVEDGRSSLPDKAQQDNPATKGGSTTDPNAQPKSGDLPAGAQDDMGKK